MTRYRTLDHPLMRMIAFDPERPAERINDHLVMVRATSNAYVVTGEDGDVIINTGTAVQGKRIREKFEALVGRPLKVSRIIFTQSHPDHTGGWSFFVEKGSETIAQHAFRRICQERKLLGKFFGPRNARVLAALIPKEDKGTAWFSTPDPEPLTTFTHNHSFGFAGRHYELISVPSGETVDSLAVWMPEEKVLFTGNWAGAIYGALPNFYTLRGDRDRSVTGWLEECQRLMELGAELLVTGHEEPIRGADRVRTDLTKLRDAVRYLHDETVKGMNAQKSLPELMAQIALPSHLETRAGRTPARWVVRSIWEEYAGWFRHELTSELYATPPRAVWPELVALAGGPDVLVERARAHLTAKQPEKALHLIEIALAGELVSRAARETELAIYEALAERMEGKLFDELGWLEGRILNAQAALRQLAGAGKSTGNTPQPQAG